jgi:outer membrane protein assembly factor BamB
VGAGTYLYALGTDTGEVRWSFQTAERIDSDVVVTSGAVYVVDEGGNLYAIE